MTEAKRLINYLGNAGVELDIEGDDLVFNGPSLALTPNIEHDLRRLKSQISQLLRAEAERSDHSHPDCLIACSSGICSKCGATGVETRLQICAACGGLEALTSTTAQPKPLRFSGTRHCQSGGCKGWAAVIDGRGQCDTCQLDHVFCKPGYHQRAFSSVSEGDAR